VNEPRNAELEAAILDAPDSADAYLVYGDWLLENGDPLGELVTVQATLAKLQQRAGKASEKRALGKREKLLLADAESRLGPLRAHEHTWSFGFLESLTMARPTEAEYAAVLAAPVARFLRELDLEDVPRAAPSQGGHPTIALLARLGVSPALRRLALLSDPARRVDLGRVPPELWSALASIEALTIRSARLDPGAIVLPHLLALSLATAVTDPLLDALHGARAPRLASLQLDAEHDEADARVAVTAARLAPLLRRWAEAGTLRHLGVTEHRAGDDLVAALLATGLAKQLATLDLSRATVSDIGGRNILANAAAFEHLASFDLSQNDLSPAVASRIEERFGLAVDTSEQGTRYDAEDD
jgi:uncharacterized protein (TIGR02996 family)